MLTLVVLNKSAIMKDYWWLSVITVISVNDYWWFSVITEISVNDY
jgi:hypothetical protein